MSSQFKRLFRNSGMEYERLDISSFGEFLDFWESMKKQHSVSAATEMDYYSAVDNLIIISHGNETGIQFGTTSDDGISIGDFTNDNNLGLVQSAPINVVDYISCNSAIRPNGGENLAHATIANCEYVNETYGWDTETVFENNMNSYLFPSSHSYSYPLSRGYIHYYRADDGVIYWEAMPAVERQYFIIPLFHIVYVETCLHSTESAGG